MLPFSACSMRCKSRCYWLVICYYFFNKTDQRINDADDMKGKRSTNPIFK